MLSRVGVLGLFLTIFLVGTTVEMGNTNELSLATESSTAAKFRPACSYDYLRNMKTAQRRDLLLRLSGSVKTCPVACPWMN
jgi:hypothetical protein